MEYAILGEEYGQLKVQGLIVSSPTERIYNLVNQSVIHNGFRDKTHFKFVCEEVKERKKILVIFEVEYKSGYVEIMKKISEARKCFDEELQTILRIERVIEFVERNKK